MRKKFLSLALVSVFMLSLSVSAHAEAASTPASQEEARLATVFQGVADVWGSNISVAEIKTLQDFAGNEYTLAEYSPFGYAIYHNSSAVVLEKSENSPSPYSGLNGDLYYAGPTHYYVYDKEHEIYTHTITGETLGTDDASAKAEVCSEAQAELNTMADTQLKAYVETGAMPVPNSITRSSDSYTYVGDHRDFFEDLTTHEMMGYYDSGEGGNCGYVAAGLVLLYYDYFHDDDFIDNDTYLADTGDAFKGEDFAKYLYTDIGDALGYSNSLNATQTAKVMQKYLKDDRDISMSYWALNMPSKSDVVAQLKLDRPVIYCDRWDNPKPAGGTVDHVIVVYGYDNSNHLIAHFGWTDYTHVECTSGAFALFVSSASAISSYS